MTAPHPLIYVAANTREIGRLSIRVDAHVDPDHKALRYVTGPDDLAAAERGSLCIDLLHLGNRRPNETEIRIVIRALHMEPLSLGKLKAKLREWGME